MLLTLMLLVLSMGFITSRQVRYGGAVKAVAFGQAKSLAEAGMEDCRNKLQRDVDFPPIPPQGQTFFSYQEKVVDPWNTVIGYYTVTIDLTYAVAPYYTLRLQSTGLLGPNPTTPTAKCSITAEMDVSLPSAGNGRSKNYYQFTSFREDTQ